MNVRNLERQDILAYVEKQRAEGSTLDEILGEIGEGKHRAVDFDSRLSQAELDLMSYVRTLLESSPRRKKFPPNQPYNRRSFIAAEKLIARGTFTLTRRGKDGEIYYTTTRTRMADLTSNAPFPR